MTLDFYCHEAVSSMKKMGLWIMGSRGRLVEVRGIEPLSENIQRNSPTCVADDLLFAVTHAHRPA